MTHRKTATEQPALRRPGVQRPGMLSNQRSNAQPATLRASRLPATVLLAMTLLITLLTTSCAMWPMPASESTTPDGTPAPPPRPRPDRSAVPVRDPGTAFHPGWQDGALMRLAPGSLRALLPQLPQVKALGVRGLLLERVLQGHGPSNGPADLRRIDPALGTLDDFDALVLAAHGAGVAVLLALPVGDAASDSGLDDAMRWWLNRAVDGLRLDATPEALAGVLPRATPLVAGYRNRLLLCPTTIEGCRGPLPLPGLTAASALDALAPTLRLLLPGTPVLPPRSTWSNDEAAAWQPLLALREAWPPPAATPLPAQGPVMLWQQVRGDERRLVLANPGPTAAVARVDELGPAQRFINELPAGGAPSQADTEGRLLLALAPRSVRVLRSMKAPGN